VVQEDVFSATWSGSTLIFTRLDGRLHQITLQRQDITPPRLSQLHGLKEIRASDDGLRLACTQETPEGLVLADLDLETGELRQHAATLSDAPTSPCWVGNRILYVARSGEGGLRALDVRNGQRRSVTFSGVDPSEATPLYVTSRGKEIATTYVRPTRETPDTRILATALWPDEESMAENIVLQGRWATQVRLAHDAIAWVPGADRLVGSVAIREFDENHQVTQGFSSLAVFRAGGGMRTVSDGLASPAQPAVTVDHMAFLSEGSVLRLVEVSATELRIPPVQVFDTAREALRPVPP